MAYARDASVGDYTRVYYYPDGQPNTRNQIVGWAQLAHDIIVSGEIVRVIHTRGALRDTAIGRIVDAD